MSSGQTLPSDAPDRVLPGQEDQRRQLRRAVAALALPAFFVIGFVLCYTSAFQAPVPHGRRKVTPAGTDTAEQPDRSSAHP